MVELSQGSKLVYLILVQEFLPFRFFTCLRPNGLQKGWIWRVWKYRALRNNVVDMDEIWDWLYKGEKSDKSFLVENRERRQGLGDTEG